MADPDNAYVTGTGLMVDGGLTAGNTPPARSVECARVGGVIGAARERRRPPPCGGAPMITTPPDGTAPAAVPEILCPF
ncbi:hypothetical protein ACWHAP_25075, partial [Streptomyces albidoflavus]